MENKIFSALIELVSIINRTDRDKQLIADAGVNMEAAAFRTFVGIGHIQPTSVGDLANLMGKNYSSVSRQIDKLEDVGLVRTYQSQSDSRIRMSELTKYGEGVNGIIRKAREKKMSEAFADWTHDEKKDLFIYLKRIAESLQKFD